MKFLGNDNPYLLGRGLDGDPCFQKLVNLFLTCTHIVSKYFSQFPISEHFIPLCVLALYQPIKNIRSDLEIVL